MKVNVIEGQIDLFSMPIQEPIKPKEEIIIDKPKIEDYNFNEIIEQYKNSCSRIVKRIHGALLVGFEDKTMYFNNLGKHEFDLVSNIGLMPGDEILIANKDIKLNDIQLSKLAIMDPAQYIKRKGDSNVIILTESKTTVINSKGWVIEYEQKPIYKDNEITQRSKEFKIGDSVEFKYSNQNCKGRIRSIYNNGETINVSWDGKRAAFYYKCLKKIS